MGKATDLCEHRQRTTLGRKTRRGRKLDRKPMSCGPIDCLDQNWSFKSECADIGEVSFKRNFDEIERQGVRVDVKYINL